MSPAITQLDRKFAELRPFLTLAQRPNHGWVRAVRDALGITTAQLARRLGVVQSRVVALEKAEKSRTVTLQSLDRAAEALGCRVVYVFVPEQPLADVLRERAGRAADKQLASVDQTMRLEAQGVPEHDTDARESLIAQLLRKPSRLWDEH